MKKMEMPAPEFNWYIEPEHIPYEGNVSGVDPETDRETEEWVRDQLESGNEAAWCMATVQVELDIDSLGKKPHPYHFAGRDGLGGMSWPSERALWKDNLLEMASNAFDGLIDNIQKFVRQKETLMERSELELLMVVSDYLLEHREEILRHELPRWAFR